MALQHVRGHRGRGGEQQAFATRLSVARVGLASPHLNLDLSKPRCDLLSQFLLSAWHWLPPSVCSTPRFSL